MANSNFVVHNGLTVGPLTIDAATGNITTTGYISGTVLGVSTNKISQDASNVTASSNFVNVAVNGSNIAAFNTGGLNLTGNLTAAYVIGNGSQLTGLPAGYTNVQVATYLPIYSGTVGASLINSTGNILATGAVLNSLTVNGNQSVTGYVNVTGNILATTAEVGSVESAGVIYANSTAVATSTSSGAVIVAGGIGVLKDSVFGGNVTIDGNLFVNGNTTTFQTNNLSINDSLIYLADDNPADTLDIGFVSAFTSPVRYQHTGFVRDATDGVWKLFANVVAEPTTTVDFTNANYSSLYVGNIQTVNSANIGSTLNVVGNILGIAGTLSSLTVNGNITVTTAYVMPSANAASSLGTSAGRWNFVYGVNGNFLSVNANYADLAEKYLADAEYVPGTVVDFGGTDEVTASTDDMSVRVAGVVSTQPGYVMNEGLDGENVVLLALTGRVPTRVVGPIHKGDMLVSNGDGRARAESLPRVGSVIGKALENFNGEDGVIEVVVGKH